MIYKKNKKMTNLQSSRKGDKLTRAALVPISIFFVLSSVVVTIKVATTGAKLASVESEMALISRENEEIKRNLIDASSLQDLDGKAEEFGFKKPEEVIYIAKDKFVASLPQE